MYLPLDPGTAVFTLYNPASSRIGVPALSPHHTVMAVFGSENMSARMCSKRFSQGIFSDKIPSFLLLPIIDFKNTNLRPKIYERTRVWFYFCKPRNVFSSRREKLSFEHLTWSHCPMCQGEDTKKTENIIM